MAASPEITTKALTGNWELNKTYSDSLEEQFSLLGIGYIVRKAVASTRLKMETKVHRSSEESSSDVPAASSTGEQSERQGASTSSDGWSFDYVETVGGGRIAMAQRRPLDGEWHDSGKNWIFGRAMTRSRWMAVGDVGGGGGEDEFMRRGWLAEHEDEGTAMPLIGIDAVCEERGWRVEEAWGFRDVAGERRLCRRAVTSKGGQRAEITCVYDYCS